MATPLLDGAGTTFEHHSFKAFTAVTGPSHVSLDWSSHMCLLNGHNMSPAPIAYSATRMFVNALTKLPFILDTGGTCYISPIKSDFKSLHSILPYLITGIGGAQVHATGIGSIELCIASNHKVMLGDVLFVPMLAIRLILVLFLNHSGGYTSSFDSNSC